MKRKFETYKESEKDKADYDLSRKELKKTTLDGDNSTVFQILEVDYYEGITYPDRTSENSRIFKVPIIRMFGITPNGNSVACNVKGFYPYFYCNIPHGLLKLLGRYSAEEITNADLKHFKECLLGKFVDKWDSTNTYYSLPAESANKVIRSITIIKTKSIYGYSNQKVSYLKIELLFPKYVTTMKKILIGGLKIREPERELVKIPEDIIFEFGDDIFDVDDNFNIVSKSVKPSTKTEEKKIPKANSTKVSEKKNGNAPPRNFMENFLNVKSSNKDDEKMVDDLDEVKPIMDDPSEDFNGKVIVFQTYESDVLFNLRFMIDNKIRPCNWIGIKDDDSTMVHYNYKLSRCQIEMCCHVDDLIPLDETNFKSNDASKISKELGITDFGSIAELRILSFDIECETRGKNFPDAKIDKIIQIATVVKTQSGKIITKNVIVLGECEDIPGCETICVKSESKMLVIWRNTLIQSDPDIITGYNINNFDIPYMMDRAKLLGVKSFPYLGRITSRACKCVTKEFSSKQKGNMKRTNLLITGRVIMDMYTVIKNDAKLDKYTLGYVSQYYLKDDKESVHHTLITKLYRSGCKKNMRRLAEYCLKDAILPLRLMDSLMKIYNYVEMSRVTQVPLSLLLKSGEQIKTFTKLLSNSSNRYITPTGNNKRKSDFKGAKVFDPIPGYYIEPIDVLDFKSLYPSIMITWNLCYTTFIPNKKARDEVLKIAKEKGISEEDAIYKTPLGHEFATSKIKKGILPSILEDFLAARSVAKKDMFAAKKQGNHEKASVLDGRQLALKISANSVYGFTGCANGKLPLIEISESVTAIGRDLIIKTQKMIEKKYNGDKRCGKVKVIYGDTDSVMVNFGVKTVKEAIELGKESSELVTKSFPGVIILEFEKVYSPYLLLKKKRYAGVKWEKPDKHKGVEVKGIEIVRRDWCKLVRETMKKSLDIMLIEVNKEKAIGYVKSIVTKILMDEIDMAKFILTKCISRDIDKYKTPQCHTVLAKKIEKRSPGSCPKKGSRVPFVIISGAKKSKVRDRAEDPIYALKNEIPIDTVYYINQLKSAMTKILKYITKDTEGVFRGEHTRRIKIKIPKKKIGILAFVKKQPACLCCGQRMTKVSTKSKIPKWAKDKMTSEGIDKLKKSICSTCIKDKDIVKSTHGRIKLANNKLKQENKELWDKCARCTTRIASANQCSNYDCSIFFWRVQIKKKYGKSKEKFEKIECLSLSDLQW